MNKKEKFTLFVVIVLTLLVSVSVLALLIWHIEALPKPAVDVQVTDVTEAPSEKTVKELQDGKPFIYIGNGLGHPVIALMMQGFLDACEKYDALCMTLVRPGFEDSDFIAEQDQALAIGASGWLSSAYSPFRPGNAKAIEESIPVCTFHTPLTQDEVPGQLAWVATDVTAYGKAAADAIADKVQCKGPIAITQNTFNDTENEAARSFTEEMETKCPGIEVLAPEIEGGELSSSIAKAATILVAHPDITAAFGTTGSSPTTWAKALEQSGHQPGDVIVIGMDYTKPNLDLVKSGWVYALVGQPIYEETYRCVELLIADLRGETVEFANVYPSPIITINDIGKYYEYDEKVQQSSNK
jgi:ribose transport system substrate-binding protein